jgi:hypothetical protein
MSQHVLPGVEDAAARHRGCALEGDMFTMAFISFCDMPGKVPNKGGKGLAVRCWAMSAMLVVTGIQLLMVWTVFLHVNNDLIESKTRPLMTAYEMIVGSNITVPLKTVEALCGTWEDQEMQDDIAHGPLRTIKMPDGSVIGPDDTYSLFYNIKQPTRSWDYGRLGSDRSVLDDIMFVISEGVSLNPFTPSGYSLLFVLTLAMLLFSIFVEFREIFHFFSMLFLIPRKEQDQEIFTVNAEGRFHIVSLTPAARIAGYISMTCRLVGTVAVLYLGTIFLFHTTLKIDLILNGLALLFILELDRAIYLATVPHPKQELIESIDKIEFQEPTGMVANCAAFGEWAVPTLMFPINFALAVVLRFYQCELFRSYFRMTSAICMFAGPTPGGKAFRAELMGPVAGFCDSILGVTCGPHVTPASTAVAHGYCVVTDQTTMMEPTVQFYLDDPKLFANRYRSDGSEKSWVDWTTADPSLYKSEHWMYGPYQDQLRKNCLQLYQKDRVPDDLEVDDDVGETMDGAPFFCPRDPLFDAVFGPVEQASIDDDAPTLQAIRKVRGLTDPYVVSVVDRCKYAKDSPEREAMGPYAQPADRQDGEINVVEDTQNAGKKTANVAKEATTIFHEDREQHRLRAHQRLHRRKHQEQKIEVVQAPVAALAKQSPTETEVVKHPAKPNGRPLLPPDFYVRTHHHKRHHRHHSNE